MANSSKKDHISFEQSNKGILVTHINTFMLANSDLGYSPSTIKTKLTLLKSFTRWAEGNPTVASNIDESIMDRFLIESGRKGAARRGDNKTLYRFLDHLRIEGAIPHQMPTFNDSPLSHLKSRYEDYLLKSKKGDDRKYSNNLFL